MAASKGKICSVILYIMLEGLPTFLEHLYILRGPLLEKMCHRENDEYWSNISHIHWIQIGDEIVSQLVIL